MEIFALTAQRYNRGPARHGLVMQWPQLPIRRIRAFANPALGPLEAAPPWLDSGPAGQPFDFGGRVRRLLDDVVCRCPELAHIQVPRILFTVTLARSTRATGCRRASRRCASRTGS